jgi:hypothetical protein
MTTLSKFLAPTGAFPSEAHRAHLRARLEAAKWFFDRAFTDAETRYQWHAYDYGWRRVVLGDRRRLSPIDEGGVWFDARLADEAEAMFRRKFGKRA